MTNSSMHSDYLKATNHTFLAILENLGDGVIFADDSDIIAYINKAARQMRGLNPSKCLGRLILDIHLPKTQTVYGNSSRSDQARQPDAFPACAP